MNKKQKLEELKMTLNNTCGFNVVDNCVLLSARTTKRRFSVLYRLIEKAGFKYDTFRFQFDDLGVECGFLVKIK